VSFLDGTMQLGSGTLSGSGVATLSTSTLTAGTHSITAAYGGDNNFNASTSSVVTAVVAAPDFGISAGTLTPSSVAPGSSAKSTITINPLGGLNPSSVALTCSVSASATPVPTCSLGAISVANNTGASVLTIATSGPHAAVAPLGQHGPGPLFAVGLLIPAILLGTARLNTRSRGKALSFCLMFLVLGGCMLEAACGSSGSQNPMTASNSGTPAGVYTITVTGGSNGVQHSTSVSLTVQ
jgi:hypothetical protein